MDIFEGLPIILKTFWFVAIPASLIFTIQTILTFVGMDSSDGLDADFDGDLQGGEEPFQLFSFRNLINFLLGFSWTGISFYSTIENQTVLIFTSFAVGALFVYIFFLIISQVQKLAEDNSFKIESTVGRVADVYLTVPGSKSGSGKVLISVKGAVHELEAMSEGDAIPSNAKVKVVRVESSSILIVETI